jgi:hypothetical protein
VKNVVTLKEVKDSIDNFKGCMTETQVEQLNQGQEIYYHNQLVSMALILNDGEPINIIPGEEDDPQP